MPVVAAPLAPGRAFHKMGGVPKVTVLKIVAIDGNQPVAIPEHWEAEGIPAPKIRVIETKGKRNSALGIGDRILARTEERGNGWAAHVMKKLAKGSEQILGVVEGGENGRFWLKSVDKKSRFDTQIGDVGDAKAGELVLAELTGNAHKKSARVTQVLGDPFAPKSFSLIAIHKFGINTPYINILLYRYAFIAAIPWSAITIGMENGLPISVKYRHRAGRI